MLKKKSKSAVKDPGNFDGIEGKIKKASDFKPEVKVVLYGKPGTGKTTLASSFPKPALLIDISEKGSDSVRDVKGLDVIRVTEWDEFEMMYWFLDRNKKGYKTVIIDTMSYAQELCVRDVVGGEKKKGKRAGDWGTMTKRDWGTVSSRMKEVITNFRDLDMNVIFIAHDRVFNSGDEDDDADGIAPSVGPRLMPSVGAVLNAAVGIIGNTFIRERFKTIKVDGKKRDKRIVEYCLRIGPHSYFITKVRSPKSNDVPEVLVDPEYEDIYELFSVTKD